MKKILGLIIAIVLLPVLPALAADRTTFSLEEKDYYNITETISLTIVSGDGYTGADVLIDNKVVTSLDGEGAGENTYDVDLSGARYLGNVTLGIRANYGNESDTFSKNILITKLGEEKNYFNTQFDGYTGGTSMSGMYGVTNGATYTKYEYGDGNVAVKTNLSGKVAGGGPYMAKDGLNISAGSLIEIYFDVYFSSSNCYMQIETRSMSGVPQNGTTTMYYIPVFDVGGKMAGGNTYSGETWYTCKLAMNTITKGLDIYVKGGEFDDYTLQKSYPGYVSAGLKALRPNFFCSSTDGGFVVLDNVSVVAKSQTPQWFVKTSFADADDAPLTDENAAVEGGKINLAFSKSMGEIADGSVKIVSASGDVVPAVATYNSETFVYTLAPTQKLRYNSQYKIVFADELASEDGSKALSGADILFTTEKYEISIASVNETADGLRIYFTGAEAAQGEVVAVCAYNTDGAMTDFDMVEILAAGDIPVLLPNAAATDKIVIYLIDSAEGNYLYQLYRLTQGGF